VTSAWPVNYRTREARARPARASATGSATPSVVFHSSEYLVFGYEPLNTLDDDALATDRS
jgi:hypothetical protein